MQKTAKSVILERNVGFLNSPFQNKGQWEIMTPLDLCLPVMKQGELMGFLDGPSLVAGFPRGNKQVQELLRKDIRVYPDSASLEELLCDKQGVYPIENEKNELVGILSREEVMEYLYNQTCLKLTELQAVFSSAHNGIVSIDTNGIITSFNPAAEKLSSVKKENALGRYIADVLVPTGLLDVVRTGENQFSTRYQVGKRKYITNRTPIIQKGKLVGAVGVFQEISEIDVISQELNSVKELNEELSAILESSYDGVMVTDKEGNLLKTNKACARITGISREDLLNSTVQDLMKMKLFSKPVVERVCKSGQPITFLETLTLDKTLLITASPVFDQQGEIKRIVINVRDMTELNELRDKLKYTRELSDQYQYELTELRSKYVLDLGVVAHSRTMKELINLAMRVAKFDSSVLLLGESGVGKEIIAKMIHDNSSRRKEPFIKINCGAIPENLLEAELFGYESGAFTGASREGKMGLFEVANKGTILLDEVGDLPFSLQVKLLRVLQEKEILRIGGNKPRRICVRIVAATNKDLKKMVEQGSFRQDLFFRLHVVPIKISPLRERVEDISPLIFLLLKKLEMKYGLKKEITSEAMDTFLAYNWPGNIRELENVIEQLFVTSPGNAIGSESIPSYMKKQENYNGGVSVSRLLPLKEAIEEVENQLVERAMKEMGNTYKAAEALDVNQSTIWRKWKKLKNAGLKNNVLEH